MGGIPVWEYFLGLTTHSKNKLVTNCHKWPRYWTDTSNKRPRLRKMATKVGAWNVRSLYGGLLRTGGKMGQN
jgi:hypothetical protein